MIALSILSVAGISACAPVGDFCDVYFPVQFDRKVAQMVVQNDRPSAVNIAANNQYFSDVCD